MKPGRKTDAVETITFWIVGIGLSLIPLLVFYFSFGNVGAFLESLGVEHRIAYLIGPAVDLAVAVLVIALSYLATRERTELWPLHLSALACGLIMILLNTAGALHIRHWRLVAVDCVGPVLLIGWGVLAPWLWREMTEARSGRRPAVSGRHKTSTSALTAPAAPGNRAEVDPAPGGGTSAQVPPPAATHTRQPSALPGGNVVDIVSGSKRAKKSAADWAELALPLWMDHADAMGSAPNATQLANALRRAHPRLAIPSSDRWERNLRSDTEALADGAGGREAAG